MKIESPNGAAIDYKAGPNINISARNKQGALSTVSDAKKGSGGAIDKSVIASSRDELTIVSKSVSSDTTGAFDTLAKDNRLTT